MTTIEWTDETWNPTRGCSRVDDDGCKNCYAMRMARRQSGPGAAYEGLTILRPKTAKRPGVDWSGKAVLVPDQLDQPLRWRKPRKVFVDSMSDLFHESLSFEEIATVFRVMAIASRHTFQILTKRPQRALEFFGWVSSQQGAEATHHPRAVLHMAAARNGLPFSVGPGETWPGPWPLPNVWLGVSVSNQKNAEERIPLLLECPAAVRFVSYEPALGPIDFTSLKYSRHYGTGLLNALTGEKRGHVPNSPLGKAPSKLDWVIWGGESGGSARPSQIIWARSTVTQCRAAGVAPFVKQLGLHPWVPQGEDPERWGEAVAWVDDPAVGPCELILSDRKGKNIDEWSADLQVREFPQARAA